MNDYQKFLLNKGRKIQPVGFKAGKLNRHLFPFQKRIVAHGLEMGRFGFFQRPGLGKTIQQLVTAHEIHKETGGDVLILAPLGVARQTEREADRWGIKARVVKDASEMKSGIVITNYDRVERFENVEFAAVAADESSILRSSDGVTSQYLIERFAKTRFRSAWTATPAPNDYMELGMHAEFLGVMTRTEMLSTFFVHDGGETSKWRLKGHAQKEFWRWISTWAICIDSPADIGFDGSDYILPPLVQKWHTVEGKAIDDGMLIPMPASTLGERRAARRESIQERLELAKALINPSTEQWLVVCGLNVESDQLAKSLKDAVEVSGSDDRDFKEQSYLDFADGKIRVLVSKSAMVGFGLNFQACHNILHFGISDSWEARYQTDSRCWRFGQKETVYSHIITSDQETAVVENNKRKEREAEQMKKEMAGIVNTAFIQADKKHTMKTDTAHGKKWTLDLHDCVEASQAIADNSVGFSVFSPPFSSLYTYSDSERDMGNCTGDDEFFAHFQFLVGELYRITMPGRLIAFHCMNLPTTKARDGVIGIRDFRGELIAMFKAAGWILHSEVTIWKDPVTAMQRTKAIGLLHKQIKKDSAMSRQGIPDYLVVMRKPGENPQRVTHGADLPVELWQRYASPVWMDINPSDTLQRESAREHNDERHICPLQLQVIQRAVHLWSNPNDLVFSPFAGIGSEGFVAVKMGRRFHGIELKKSYWDQARLNLMAAEEAVEMDLFANVEENRCAQTQMATCAA